MRVLYLQRIFLISLITTVWVIMVAALSEGICQEGRELSPGGTGFGILPITRALTEMPMPISFHGSTHDDPYLSPADSAGRPGKSDGHAQIRLPLAAPGLNAQLNRFRGFLFRYIQVAPSEPLVSGTSEFDYPEKSVSAANDISLEFQADITDLSGALFIVMKL